MDFLPMQNPTDSYQWLAAFYVMIAVLAIPFAASFVLKLVPAFGKVSRTNKEAAAQQVKKSYYNPIQNRSKRWGFTALLINFYVITPWVITTESQAWWEILLDVFVILMVYDFFYYLVHRFLFHDGGPLVWVHAVHHQQRNPCRQDSNYLHPIETCAGVLLYGATIGLTGLIMGDFSVITIAITCIAFSEINLHNHDRMQEDRFPFKYLNYMSYMHHVHHARFTGGNFATISLFYDWLFGTYDTGNGWGPHLRPEGDQRDARIVKAQEEETGADGSANASA
ncbi:sterol desaturase family protein [Pseudomaricurvus sp. HS19]|uniref:sterol desaturase family protein n=1 Tax=Pseudomaricurvus sp. HS19 TaxID=2692626 RepID=UPI00136DBCF8|nr:sterol desaturase family protein [Pseudomaricurvus sp. HS19]MYM61832.1 fatty acid hydroxylase family protein [Pseudomaricurvus sp. HS19]